MRKKEGEGEVERIKELQLMVWSRTAKIKGKAEYERKIDRTILGLLSLVPDENGGSCSETERSFRLM